MELEGALKCANYMEYERNRSVFVYIVSFGRTVLCCLALGRQVKVHPNTGSLARRIRGIMRIRDSIHLQVHTRGFSEDDMKKTLLLSMVGAVVLSGCPTKDDNPTDTTTVNDDIDGDGDGDTADAETTDDGTDTGAADTSGVGFVPPDDFMAVSECDPFMQDCPEDEKCVPYASSGSNWDANKCVPVTGSGAPGDTCVAAPIAEATDDCGADSVCWDTMDIDGQDVGVCTSFCDGTADAPICEPGSSCLIANEGSITLCIGTCDPLLQDCGDGLACFWANTGFNCIFTTQEFPTGEPCGFINDCAPGNYCADAAALPVCDGSACCASFCDLTDPVCGVAGTECVTFFEEGMAPPGFEDVGLCILPA